MEQIENRIGRPPAIIDWKVVDEFLECGCTGADVARQIGIAPYTFYERCERDNGIPFHQYAQLKRVKGENILRKHQYDKAIGNTEKGDNTLLIWLGKVMLKQTDKLILVNETDKKSEESIDAADGKSKELVDDYMQD